MPSPCAASSLLEGVLRADTVNLREVARTRVSVHFETGRSDVPVLTVTTPDAIRLPNSLQVATLPEPGPTPISTWTVARWWRPPRPRTGFVCASHTRNRRASAAEPMVAPDSLIGRGPGLTPAGDDVVAGALVAAYAVDDPRRPEWAAQTRAAIEAGRTTTVSRALLHHAIEGYGIPQLVAFVDALTAGQDPAHAERALLAVGHTSGAALRDGVLLAVTHQRGLGAA